MRIKLDENLPQRLVAELSALGHDVDTVEDEDLVGAIDPDVWKGAQDDKRFFITQDLDFSDIRQFQPGTHHGVLILRLRNPGRKALLARVKHLFETENVEEWKGGFVIVTEKKIRVRKA